MANILQATVQIKGIRPILWHAFGPEAIPLEKQERTGVAGNDPEEWRKTVLATKEGQLYLLPTYAFGCLRDAAKYTKKGKGSIQGALCSTLQITDEVLFTDRYLPSDLSYLNPGERTDPVYLDISSVRNPSTKARNVRYRVAASSGWTTQFGIQWDKTIVSRGEMEAVLHDAGQLVGLGDGRSIGYGRFTIEEFRVQE